MCEELVGEMVDKTFRVPEVDFLDGDVDDFAIHRKVFLFACEEITRRFNETSYSGKLHTKTIQNILAHSYFKALLMPKIVGCVGELVRALEGVIDYHIPPLKREIERFICNNMLVENEKGTGLQYVQQALLLATRYDLAVVKMMASGIILDRINIEDDVSYIREELSQVAIQLPFRALPSMSDDDESSADEMLVGSVVDQLQLLSKRMRRVSISPCQSSSAPSTPLAALTRPRTASNTPSTCSTTSSSSSSEPAVRSMKIGRFYSETLITPTATPTEEPTETPKPVFQRTTPRRMQRIIIDTVDVEAPTDLFDSVFSEESIYLPISDDQLTIGRDGSGLDRNSF
uniref:BTB domain-containing protein n=1 Tax=Steinernema glaseri TaxID=37863 RepID=A0A1I7ZLC7_9BILA